MIELFCARSLPFALLLAPLLACADLGDVTFEEESAEAIVMGSGASLLDALPTQGLLPPLSLQIDLEEELERQDVGPARAVYLDALSLVITDSARPEGDSDDFDFIDAVDVYVESRLENSSLKPRQIAQLASVPQGQTAVDFDVFEEVDLKPYIEEGVRLTTSGTGRVPADDTSLKALVTIRAELL